MSKKQLFNTKYKNFKDKVYKDLTIYEKRLAQINFLEHDTVLDLGSGFGQWSISLSKFSKKVYSLELDEYGIKVQNEEIKKRNISNIYLLNADMTNIPLEDKSVDLIFAYSSIYFTDYKKAIQEMSRVLKPKGKFYICVNSYGWYLKNIIDFKRDGYSTFTYGVKSFIDTFSYYLFGRLVFDESIIISKNAIKSELAHNNLKVTEVNGEGKINFSSNKNISFFKDKYLLFDSVFEVLGEKSE